MEPQEKSLQPPDRERRANKDGSNIASLIRKDINNNRNSNKLTKLIKIAKEIFKKNQNCQPVGGYCSRNRDCQSNHCKNGVCFNSEYCKALKYDGQRFDVDRVNIIFVGSGFESLIEWQQQVTESYSKFSQYSMFSSRNERFNAFYVTVLSSPYCDFGCAGIDRLLCCNVDIAKSIADLCFPSNERQQTIVVHNDEQYGGAGYLNANLATISRNPDGPLVAIHELGHSLFNLVDEYSYGPGTSRGPNCDGTSCKKWLDLIEQPGVLEKYGQVGCTPGCQNDGFFVGQTSFMEDISAPVGAVNERFTCCTYLILTGGHPSYCDVFNFEGNSNSLQEYCDLDYQHLMLAPPSPSLEAIIYFTPKPKYTTVENPLQVTLSLINDSVDDNDKPRIDIDEILFVPPGIFNTIKVEGDFDNLAHAAAMNVDEIVQVTVLYETGTSKVLLLNKKSPVLVPPPNPKNTKRKQRRKSHHNDDNGDQEEEHKITVKTETLDFVCEDGWAVTTITAQYIYL